jgi:tetratricopeptide (TPR) repeat protein
MLTSVLWWSLVFFAICAIIVPVTLQMSQKGGSSIQERIQQTLGHHQHGRFPEALEGYEQILRSLPSEDAKTSAIKVSLHGNAGAIYLSQGSYDDAKRHFEESVRLQPENGVARYNLAVLLSSKMSNHAAALKHCALGIKYSPENHKLYHLMGNIMQSLGKEDQAEKYFNLAESMAVSERPEGAGPKEAVGRDSSFRLSEWLENLSKRLVDGQQFDVIFGEKTFTVQRLSQDPLILQIDDFVTDELCTWIRSKAEGHLEKSFTMGSQVISTAESCADTANDRVRDESEEDPKLFRSSYNAWVPREEKLQGLQEQLSTVLQIPLRYILQNSEDLQVVHYKSGGQFKIHQDSSNFHPRLFTALIYLNDPPAGSGETWFPYGGSHDLSVPRSVDEAVLGSLEVYESQEPSRSTSALPGLKVAAKKGRVVIFFNHNNDGQVNPLAVHAGLPPRKHSVDSEVVPEKWIANYWVQLNNKEW